MTTMQIEQAKSNLQTLMEGNARFAQGSPRPRGGFVGLPEGVDPSITAVILGCADARVVPEIIFDQEMNSLFSVRTAGNIAGSVQRECLEFAVANWNVPLLLVLGHTDCRAVMAAMGSLESRSPQVLPETMHAIYPALQGHSCGSEEHAAICQNARHSADLLCNESKVIQERVEHAQLLVVSACYSVENGRVFLLD